MKYYPIDEELARRAKELTRQAELRKYRVPDPVLPLSFCWAMKLPILWAASCEVF